MRRAHLWPLSIIFLCIAALGLAGLFAGGLLAKEQPAKKAVLAPPGKTAVKAEKSAKAAAAEAPKANEVGEFMRAKLTHSQKVLEGLTIEDFDMIAKHSQEMSLLSQAATWQVLQTPEYHQHSTEFRRSADALTDAAREKNLDGAALAYVDVTLKCVNCHKYVRKVGLAEGPLAPLDLRDALAGE